MAISRFKFVSPGIFIKEVDNSRTSTPSPVVGPTVIGRSVKGPLMKPVRVDSYADFVELFGEPNPGGYNGDIWRSGVTLAPAYGAYAAKAYLAFNGPLTFVRLGGLHNTPSITSTTSEEGKVLAGWKVKNIPDALPGGITGSAGAYGLFIAAATSSGDSEGWIIPAGTTASLASVFYVNKGGIGLVGSALSGTTNSKIDGSGSVWTRSTQTGRMSFTAKLYNSAGAAEPITFDLDAGSKDFIRSKFNTNPTLINSDVTSLSAQKDYFLGETYESSVRRNVVCSSVSGTYVGIILGLQGYDSSNTLRRGNSFKRQAEASKSSWIVSQHKGDSGSYTPNADGEYPIQKLFRFHSLAEGDWNQNNIKISISDIKPSPTRFQPFGTFTVSIRKMKDNDQNPEILEIYTGLDLNPVSPNYISKRIGNTNLQWDYERKMFNEFGEYPNTSKFVYVEVDDTVKGAVYRDALPFGFYGLPKYKTVGPLTGSKDGDQTFASSSFITTKFFNSVYNTTYQISGNNSYSASFAFPELSLVDNSVEDSAANTLERVYFGLNTKIDGTKLFDEEIIDLVRAKPTNIEENSSLLTYSTLFSLDDVMFSGSTGAAETTSSIAQSKGLWAVGNRKKGYSITSKTDFKGYDNDVFQKVARFTLPLYGGFNGFDITEKEPLSERTSNSPLSSTDDESTSYIYNSLDVAINSVSDPEVVETNLITIPGIQNEKITNKLIETCEQRADALALIDITGDFKSEFESKSEVKPVTSTAITNIKARNLNSSYGCCFFPAVLARDTAANALVSLPSSVVALGVLGSSAALSELWFAPAGFNRGGLSNGAAGFPVVGVKTKLTSKDRDNLYEVNVNPIASFPAEGIVVFGQKTLQATPSALDRINVRRLMIYLKKEISRMATTVLFDPNLQVTWNRFTNQVIPFLQSVQSRFGLSDFRVILDETTTTAELVDRNIVYAKIFLKPARAIEFIALDFILTNTGASFDD